MSLSVPGSVLLGLRATYLARVSPPGSRPGPTVPSGSVAFFDNGQPVVSCGSQPLVSGIARCTIAYDALGQHTITAQYSGDANFTGAASPAQTIGVVPVAVPASTVSAPAAQTTPVDPPPTPVLGIVNSSMLWSFYFTPHYTAVRALSVDGVPAAASVLVRCRGRGCPFATHIASIPKPKHCGQRGRPRCPTSGTVNLAPAFGQHRLNVGVTIAVLIRRPNWIGKYYSFEIRPRQGPRIGIDCLAPGSTRPGVGCSR